jgi:hypothetical protein
MEKWPCEIYRMRDGAAGMDAVSFGQCGRHDIAGRSVQQADKKRNIAAAQIVVRRHKQGTSREQAASENAGPSAPEVYAKQTGAAWFRSRLQRLTSISAFGLLVS